MEHENAPIPQPISILVCDTCGQPWDEHQQLARRRADNDWYHTNEEIHEMKRIPDDLPSSVSSFECIELLKIANRGPTGQTGATGPRGIPGPAADSSWP